MYLVLDDAMYHHHRGPTWYLPAMKRKSLLADFLCKRNFCSIAVDNRGVSSASSLSADARGKAGGPTEPL